MSWTDAKEKYDADAPLRAAQHAVDEENRRLANEERRLAEEKRLAKRKADNVAATVDHLAQLRAKRPGPALFEHICRQIEEDPKLRAKIAQKILSGESPKIVWSNPFPQGGISYDLQRWPDCMVKKVCDSGYTIGYDELDVAISFNQEPVEPYAIQHPDCAGYEVYADWTTNIWNIFKRTVCIGVRPIRKKWYYLWLH